MSDSLRRASKFLSYVLRHRPDEIGLTLDDEGWADIDTLVTAARDGGRELTRDLVREVVRTNDKQRFRISDDGMRIRASQGHSIQVDLALEAAVPPDQLFHGTADRNVDAIMVEGLQRQSRQHVRMFWPQSRGLQRLIVGANLAAARACAGEWPRPLPE